MKKLARLLSALTLMVILIPTTVTASSTHTVTATANIVAVQREVAPVGFGPDGSIHLAGTAIYAGVITSATRQDRDWSKLVGANLTAREDVDYLIDSAGNVLSGSARGRLTIQASNGTALEIEFESAVSGNVFTGPASDTGDWEVVSANGSMNQVKNAAGAWTATVAPAVIGGQLTLAGTAVMSGSY